MFPVLWENQCSTKSWYTILCNFFSPENFWNTRVPYEFFRYCETKGFREKIVISPSYPYNFSVKKNFWIMKGSPKNFFDTVRKPFSDKIVIHHLMQFFLIQKFSETQGSPYDFFRYCETKVLRESRHIPLLSIKFSDRRNFLKNEGFPYEIFRYCEKINFRQNRDTPSYAIFFNPEIFWNTRVPLRIFSVLWDKNISRENRDIPFLSIHLFDKKNFWKMKGSPTKFFGTVRKSIFDKIVIHHLMQFFESRNFLKRKVPPTIFSGTVRQKISREIRDISLLSKKFFDKRMFLKNEGFPYKTFRYCEKIKFRQNRGTPSYAIFFCRNFLKHKGPPTNFFGTVRQRSFERKSWYALPIHNFFRWKIILKNEGFHLRNFSVLWEIQLSTKSWYTILCNFFNPEYFWNTEIFSVLWDKKVSRENRDIPFLSIKLFDTRNFLRNAGSTYELFW